MINNNYCEYATQNTHFEIMIKDQILCGKLFKYW